MQSVYLATIFAGALVCLLSSLLLLVRRKSRERSRLILAFIVFFSVLNYIPRFIAVSKGYDPELVVSTKMLLIGNFMVVSYIMYPIEVIRPGWLNFSRIVQLYAFWLLLLTLYLITSFAGVRYTSYSSLPEMIANVGPFEVWFCLFLCLLLSHCSVQKCSAGRAARCLYEKQQRLARSRSLSHPIGIRALYEPHHPVSNHTGVWI